VWWPSSPSGGGRMLRESSPGNEPLPVPESA
jgi:hypothetical protein